MKKKKGLDSKGKKSGGFTQVAPGVLVNTDKFSVSISHPDHCFILTDTKKTGVMSNDGSLLIFSQEELANNYLKAVGRAGTLVAVSFSWEKLVDKFGRYYKTASLDQTGEDGFFERIPLRKGI
jgi:hypothetical protein